MSDVYEGLTSGQYEDWEPEYDVDDVEDDDEGEYPIMGPLSGFDLYILSKYTPASDGNIVVITDNDTGYGPNSYFAQSMITE